MMIDLALAAGRPCLSGRAHRRKALPIPGFWPALLLVLTLAGINPVRGQASLPVYTDTLVNSFSDWSFNVEDNLTNTTVVYTNGFAISVIITKAGGALSLHSPTFNSTPYANISFWINGGPTGGQRLKVYGAINGNAQTADYVLPALTANTWVKYTVPLATLGVANNANFDGLLIEDNSGGAQPVFYVADIQIGPAPPPALVTLNINAASTLRPADSRWFGVNLATWDGYLGNSVTVPFLQAAGMLNVRLPGGSGADGYHWAQSAAQNATFYQVVTNLGANGNAYITVNYGSGTSNEAAAWVSSVNVTNQLHVKYWEIGNECYGTWENDQNTYAHDPYTYAVRAAGYMAAMRAVDPTIKIGVVATPGDDSDANGYDSHPAYDARTGQSHNGWVPVMLTTLKSLGARPDFLIHHVYPQYASNPSPPNPSPDSDPLILQNNNWAGDAATLRQEISDYWGAGGTNIELCCTENNSDAANGGKQLSSLVNGMYIVDTLSRLMQTEFNSYIWWDLRNGEGSNGDIDASLYGWRIYGDEGIISNQSGLNPTYYAFKLMQYFVRPGDTVLNASSSYLLLSTYAALRSDGALNVLVINKDPITNFLGQINLGNYAPATNATVHSFGIQQDNAAHTNINNGLSGNYANQDIATQNYPTAGNSFTYSFPPYTMTVFTFLPTNYLTLAAAMPAGANWNSAAYWSDGNPASVSAANNPGSVYDVLAGALLRSPASGGGPFPGQLLYVNGNGNWISGGGPGLGELRLTSSPVTVPWLKMNGGQMDLSVGADTQSVLNGRMDILANTPFYNNSANDEGLTVNAFLTGTGNVEWRDSGAVLTQGRTLNIAGNTNTYTGTWHVMQGTLLGGGTNALGTNSITVDPAGNLETTYDLHNTNAFLELNGKMLLHQNDTFGGVTIGGVTLTGGTRTFAQLNAAFPANFPAAWALQSGSTVTTGSGSLTVYATPPAILQQPAPASQILFAGQSARFGVAATGQFLQYQWCAGPVGSGTYTNLLNGGGVAGVNTGILTCSNLTVADTADYIVVLTNSSGSVTSSVARLIVAPVGTEAYQLEAMAQAPVACYPLNETANPAAGNVTAYDYAGGFNGVYGAAVQNGYNGIAGPRTTDGLAGFAGTNYAAKFTPNVAKAQITLPALNLDADTVTIAAWLKPVTPQNNSAGVVFCRAGTTVAGLCYTGTQTNGDYTLGYNWDNDPNVYGWNSGLNVPSGRWSLVVLAVSPTNAVLYVANAGGIATATHTCAHVVQNFDGVTLIGDDSNDGGNGGRDFNGAIDEVMFFNQTLSSNQVAHLYTAAATAGVYATPPTIIQQPVPANQVLFAGESQSFTFGGTGQFLNYQWCAGPIGGGVYANLVNGGSVAGATNAMLTLTNLTPAESADYVVVLTNTSGAVTSSVARLTVVAPNFEAYQAAAAAQVPVDYYPLNETGNPAAGGVVAYDYVRGLNGVYGTAVQNGYAGVAGPRAGADGLAGFANTNYAARFTANLSNALITLPPLNLDANTVTLAAWLKPVAPQNSAAGVIFCRAGTTVAGLCYTSTQANGNFTLGYNWNNDPNVYGWNSGLNVPAGQWSLVVLAVAPSRATLYIINTSGVTSATHPYAHVVQNFDGVTLIGGDSNDGGGGGRDFNGVIDEVAVFNQTLSLTQVEQMFAAACAPVAAFTAAPTNGWAPMTAVFTDTSTGAITGRLWNFGDGTTLNTTATTVTHTYAGAGNYLVTLAVTGPGGSGTNTATLVANPVATPQILSVNLVQNNLIIVGQGSPAASYGLWSATNVWTMTNGVPVAGGTFDPVSGTGTNQVPVGVTNPALFFRLQSPYP